MLIWSLAFRNLFRHRGRLILNLILLVGGISTIVCFKGFKTHILTTIQELVVDAQTGHIQIAKKKFWENAPVEQVTDRMMENPTQLISQISSIEGVQFVPPRLEFFGLVNKDDQSVSAHFIGLQPDVEVRAQKSVFFIEGKPFLNSKETILSTGLKSQLSAKPTDEVTIVAQTLAGGINAMDLSVSGIFSSGFSEIDNGTIFLPLKDTQKILDTSYVDRLVVRVSDDDRLFKIKGQIADLIKNSDLEVKDWKQLAELYVQVENFYIFQNIVIEFIIISLLFLSVANTVSMTVFERLSEIGTLRALGDYEGDIQKLFLVESFILGMIAITLSVPVSTILVQIVKALNFSIVLPLASQPLPVLVVPTWDGYLEASLSCLFSVVVASLLPARKGARVSIVSALGAKI